MLDAVFVTALLIAINSVLRPLSRDIDRRSLARLDTRVFYQLRLFIHADYQSEAEYEVTRIIASHALVLRDLRAEKSEDADNSVVLAVLESNTDNSKMIDAIAAELRTFPWVQSVEWVKIDIEPE